MRIRAMLGILPSSWNSRTFISLFRWGGQSLDKCSGGFAGIMGIAHLEAVSPLAVLVKEPRMVVAVADDIGRDSAAGGSQASVVSDDLAPPAINHPLARWFARQGDKRPSRENSRGFQQLHHVIDRQTAAAMVSATKHVNELGCCCDQRFT